MLRSGLSPPRRRSNSIGLTWDGRKAASLPAPGSFGNALSQQAYLCGEALTEADVRLFTTLIRFHYDDSHRNINPTGIVPAGLDVLQQLG